MTTTQTLTFPVQVAPKVSLEVSSNWHQFCLISYGYRNEYIEEIQYWYVRYTNLSGSDIIEFVYLLEEKISCTWNSKSDICVADGQVDEQRLSPNKSSRGRLVSPFKVLDCAVVMRQSFVLRMNELQSHRISTWISSSEVQYDFTMGLICVSQYEIGKKKKCYKFLLFWHMHWLVYFS